mmetsp:Transcript_140517/g.244680  ORF Transcript_140517/g.244680 Transcript_140517/m.244680 type:complete len:211 (+) Transcript_140517:1228-1860(+)
MSSACRSHSERDNSTGPLSACVRTTSKISFGIEGIPDSHETTSASSHSSTGLATSRSLGGARWLLVAFTSVMLPMLLMLPRFETNSARFPAFLPAGGVDASTILKDPEQLGGGSSGPSRCGVPMLLRRDTSGDEGPARAALGTKSALGAGGTTLNGDITSFVRSEGLSVTDEFDVSKVHGAVAKFPATPLSTENQGACPSPCRQRARSFM